MNVLAFIRARALKTPSVAQAQLNECALASLAIILAHFGRPVALRELRRISGVSRHGLGVKDIIALARHYGLIARAYRKEPEDLVGLGFPLIVFTGFIHYQVVDGVTAGRICLNDPGMGRINKPLAEFAEEFTGITLQFEPGPDFQPVAARAAHPRRFVFDWLRPFGPALLGIAALQLLATACAVGAALAVGRAVAAVNSPWPTALLLSALLLGAGAAAYTRQRWQAAISRRLASGQGAALLRHCLALPYAFHSYRFPANLHGQISLARAVAGKLCGDLLGAVLGGLSLLVYLLAASGLHPPLAGVLATTLLLGGALLAWRLRALLPAQRRAAASHPADAHRSIELLEMHRTAGMEEELVSSAVGDTASHLRHEQPLAAAQCDLTVWHHAMLWLLPGSVLLGAALIDGATPGTAAALSLLATLCAVLLPSVLAPISLWSGLAADISLIQDIQAHPQATEPPLRATPAGAPSLRLHDVSFGYAPKRPPLLRGLSFELKAGEQLGISGVAGCGKSTLAGLVAGLHAPWTGEIEFTGDPQRIAWVGQNGLLFAASVRENISLGDPAISAQALAAAVRDAGLDEVLAGREAGLESPVAERGINFSGGQRQRLELARALARQPQLVVLDEALEALDPALETRILAALRARGCAVLVISHRASSLAACDRQLVLENGQLLSSAEVAASAETSPPAIKLPKPTIRWRDARQGQALQQVAERLFRHARLPAREFPPLRAGARESKASSNWPAPPACAVTGCALCGMIGGGRIMGRC